jgi:glutaredoxin
MITVFSKPNCPHCVTAKTYLASNGIAFEEVDVSADDDALAFLRERGHRSVPQIYVGETLLVEGGSDGLRSLTADEIRTREAAILG